MLQINHAGTNTKVIHEDPVLSSDTKVPSRREAIEALGLLQRMIKDDERSLLVNNEKITSVQMFDVIRRFVLTR